MEHKMYQPVDSKQEVLERIALNAGRILSFGVQRLGLFGSFVRNEQGAESDVDLLVDFEPGKKNLRNLVALSQYLQQVLGRQVELVTPNGLNTFTGKYILQEVENVPIAA